MGMFAFLDRLRQRAFDQLSPQPARPPSARPPGAPAVGPGGNPDGAAELAAQTLDEPTVHPMVQEAIDRRDEAGHEQRLDAAKAAVGAENSARGNAAAQQMVDTAGPTVVQNLVIGGGTMATLDMATLAEANRLSGNTGQVMGVSMPAASDRPITPAPAGGEQAAGTGQQRMDPWNTYGHFQIGQTGEQLAPVAMNPDGTPKVGPDGKPVGDPGLLGMAIQPAQLHPTTEDTGQEKYARSSEMSLATAETLRQSEVPLVPGKPVGAIKLPPPEGATEEEKRASGWPADAPDGARAMITVEVMGPDGKPRVGPDGKAVTEQVFATETLDVCVGPGPGRKFQQDETTTAADGTTSTTRKVIAPADAQQLEAAGDVVYAEAFLGGQGNTNKEKVLVFGGGDTGAWVAQTALGQQAVDGAQAGEGVDWAARPVSEAARPAVTQTDADGNKTLTPFGECQKRIKDLVDSGAPVPPDVTADYNRMMEAHKTSTLATAQDRYDAAAAAAEGLADPAAKAAALKAAEADLKKTKDTFNPFGDEKPRNEGTGDAVPQIQKDILRVTPVEGGKVQVTFEDGSQQIYDRVIGSMGQDATAEGGPKKLVGNIPLVPIMEGDPPFPVGLQSADGAVRVMGASAWMCMSNVQDETLRKGLMNQISARAATEVSPDSRGVNWGFENMGDNPARANAVLLEQRQLAEASRGASGGATTPSSRAEEAADELARASTEIPPEVDGPGHG